MNLLRYSVPQLSCFADRSCNHCTIFIEGKSKPQTGVKASLEMYTQTYSQRAKPTTIKSKIQLPHVASKNNTKPTNKQKKKTHPRENKQKPKTPINTI